MKSDHHYQPQQHPGNESLGSRLGISDDDTRSSGTFSVSTAAARFLLEDLSDVTSNIPTDILQILSTTTTAVTYEGSGSSSSSSLVTWSSSTTATPPPLRNATNGDVIDSFYFYETEQFVFLWILFTVIVLGNSAVLVTLFLHRARKSRMNFFIKQLALADLCVGLLNVLTDIVWRITIEWRAGNMACKLIKFLQASVTYASTYVLVALSIDRYDAITHPMNFSGSYQTQCWIDLGSPWAWKMYMSLVSAALFVLPALIISACYAIIIRTIWAKGAILGHSDRRGGRSDGGGANSDDRGSRRASSRGIIPRAKVKTVKMTIVIVIVFVMCWSPYIIFDLLQVFDQIPRTQTNLAIATFVQSLAPLNSAANPLIYCLFSTQVCRTLRRLPPFRWFSTSRWCCKSSDRSNTIRTAGGPRLLNSQDSVRTLTTSLAVSTRRSTMNSRPQRVTIVDRPKTIIMSEV